MNEGLKNKFYVGQDVFYLNSCKRSYFHAEIQRIELRYPLTPITNERYLVYVVKGDGIMDSYVSGESELFATEQEVKKEIIRSLQHECTETQNKLQEYMKAFGFEDATTAERMSER